MPEIIQTLLTGRIRYALLALVLFASFSPGEAALYTTLAGKRSDAPHAVHVVPLSLCSQSLGIAQQIVRLPNEQGRFTIIEIDGDEGVVYLAGIRAAVGAWGNEGPNWLLGHSGIASTSETETMIRVSGDGSDALAEGLKDSSSRRGRQNAAPSILSDNVRKLFIMAAGMTVFLPLFGGVQEAVSRFPSAEWERYETPGQAGFSSKALAVVREESGELDTAALMIVHRGRIVDAWGDLEKKFECHSLRKSFLSALYGIQVERGRIDLNATMRGLGIDDNDPLSEIEKQATVRMLLKARSGVFHPALYETAAMAARRPERHSHQPGTFWYYNNWDFNALGTIYEQETGEKIHESFERRIAKPIGMTDYSAGDGHYVTGSDSRHPAYPFQMSTLDMARFGLLFLNGGKWKDQEVVPEWWVKESTASHSDAGDKGGYGYMWWVSVDGRHFAGAGDVPAGTYTGRGAGGHMLAIVPADDLVVVHRVNTSEPGNSVAYEEFGKLLTAILKATDATPRGEKQQDRDIACLRQS